MLTVAEYADAKARLLDASKAYYADGTSDLVDVEFDALEADVAEFEAAHPHEVTGTPVADTVAAGTDVAGTVEHAVPMLSLEKITDDVPKLIAWLGSSGLTHPDLIAVEPKLDGSSMSVHYENGRPVRLVTRGDGWLGEDRTAALADIVNLPTSAYGFTGEVRGEVIFTREQFVEANAIRVAHDKPVFANARNGVAGALAGASSRDYRIPMSFYVYDALFAERPSNHRQTMRLLGEYGFDLALECMEPMGLRRSIEFLSTPEGRARLDVETDGLVIKADRAEDRVRLGERSKSPRWAIAYKFAAALDDLPTTTLEDVEWAVGRTGVIAPRARIAPVSVGGTTVTYATLHNPDDIARRGFMLGDTVYVRRAGEVIPRLEGVKAEARDGSQTLIALPEVCPNCGSDIDRSQARWRCVRGVQCHALAGLEYAVSRDALDVDGLSGSVLGAAMDAGLVSDLADLFALNAEQIAALPTGRVTKAGDPVAVGATTAQKIVASLEASKSAGLGRVITALGIPSTGRSLSRRLAEHFGSMDALLAADAVALAGVDKIGPTRAETIAAHLARPDVRDMIERLGAAGATMTMPVADPGAKPLAGLSVCISGTMIGPLAGKSRTEVAELVESLGARATSSVSKYTSMLLAGDKAGSKAAKAESLGVRVVTEDEFAAEYLGAMP